ncbi:MAG: immunoglobulin domain-containing protein [Verrucomicrobia bacterium]|nr:immunoglobulin domain-containing protein [Verrucomicrobiota bacterium]
MRPFRTLVALCALLTAPLLAPAQQTWDDRSALVTAGGVSNFTDAAYGNGFFFLITSSTPYWRSAAGTAGWTTDFFRDTGTFYNSNGVAYGAGTFVVVGQNGRIYQHPTGDAGGLAWNARGFNRIDIPSASNPVRNTSLRAVRFLNGRFVVAVQPFVDSVNFANSYSELLSSPDGMTWTSHKFPVAQTGNATCNFTSLLFRPGGSPGTGSYVLGTTINDVVVVNEALTTATRVNVAASNATNLRLAATTSLVVGVSSTGRIFTSPTGTAPAWTARTNPVAVASSLNAIFHDGTRFVAVGQKSTSPAQALILTSADGITWTEATSVPVTPRALSTVLRADGLWLTGGESRVLLTSGSSSVALPTITQQPVGGSATVGGNFALNVSASGPPAPTIAWFRNGVQLTDGGRISGATTGTLTITGATFADAGSYQARATNIVGTTVSDTVALRLTSSNNGATLYPFGVADSGAGDLRPGTSPPQVTVTFGAPNVGLFTAGGAVVPLANTVIGGTAYTGYGGLNPAGTTLLLYPAASAAPSASYDLASGTATLLPPFPLPTGPVTSISAFSVFGLAANGDFIGIVRDQASENRGFHFSAATQTYTLLGNVPNAGNDIASNPTAISADGLTVAGYERTGVFNGAFLWTAAGGFTLLPTTSNGGTPNGDIRHLSPGARFVVGFGGIPSTLGSGNTALRWDRGTGLGAPLGFALPRPPGTNFADCRTVLDDGTVAGHVRTPANVEHAAVWLPSGALVPLAAYLTSTYGLDLTGFRLSRVTSISPDRRTLAGNAINPAGLQEGWILTLPAPLDLADPQPNLTMLLFGSELANGETLNFSTGTVGVPGFSYTVGVRNDGASALTGFPLSLSGPEAGDFSVTVNNLPGSLGIFQAANFTVRFTPSGRGQRSATLTLGSNDPDQPVTTLQLVGVGQSAAEAAFASYLNAAGVPFDQRTAASDPDRDGLPNLLEFALGLPAQTASAGALPQPLLAGDALTLTYAPAQSVHVSYLVEASSDLVTWTSVGIDQGVLSGGSVTATVPLAVGRFVRLRCTLN